MGRPKRRSNGISESKIESERLKAAGIEPEIIKALDSTTQTRTRLGSSTHLSSLQKRERGILDNALTHMPTPDPDGLTYEDIAFLNRHMYGVG